MVRVRFLCGPLVARKTETRLHVGIGVARNAHERAPLYNSVVEGICHVEDAAHLSVTQFLSRSRSVVWVLRPLKRGNI